MFILIVALALLLLALLVIALRKTYYFLPAKELKRRARHGDRTSKALYRAVAYGPSLGVLLWTVIAVTVAGSFVLLAKTVPPVLAFSVEVLVIVFGFAWMPTTRITNWGLLLVASITPIVEWLLNYLNPLLSHIVTFIRNYQQITVHTGLYEREDLLALLKKQKQQSDSRFSSEELSMLEHVLTFGEKMVGDCMVPRSVVRMVHADENIGPVVIRELHDSGYSRFPVYHDKRDNIVGTLYLRDLVNLKHTGKVHDVMDQNVYYVHEEYPLEQVLHAFLTTKHHLFIVVNSFEEFVGIITIEDILENILGCKIVDEFNYYDDMRAVAANHARIEHKEHKKQNKEVIKHENVSEETTEVVK